LSPLAEKVLQEILAYTVTKKDSDSRDFENEPHPLYERKHCMLEDNLQKSDVDPNVSPH
jgi:hypothetical protein